MNDPETAPEALPRISSTDENEAFDIRGTASSGPMEIVGWSNINNVALLWRWDGSEWDLITLNNVSECLTGTLTTLKTARAINANGWIAGDTDGVGWVLVPRCPADLANDQGTTCPNGRVNVFDLFVLLDNWNTDGLGADLAAPTNVVDVFDLFVLLAAWTGLEDTTCPEVVGTANSLNDVVTGAGLTMDDWDEFMDVMTNSEDEDERDNYLCWMKNYLTACVFCPPCIDEDPFK